MKSVHVSIIVIGQRLLVRLLSREHAGKASVGLEVDNQL